MEVDDGGGDVVGLGCAPAEDGVDDGFCVALGDLAEGGEGGIEGGGKAWAEVVREERLGVLEEGGGVVSRVH